MLATLTNDDIVLLYESFVVKDESYFRRFRDIRSCFSDDEYAALEAVDPPRVVSLVDFKEWIAKYGLASGSQLLLTSRQDYEIRYLNYEANTVAEYPPHDLHVLSLPQHEHDFVLLNQTLEHLHSPLVALRRLRDHMREGGYIYITVPTINIPHMTPIHFWGITPVGLCAMLVQAGFQICECGYWGNLKYIRYLFTRNRWPRIKDVLTWGKLETNPGCQAQTWILARKGRDGDTALARSMCG